MVIERETEVGRSVAEVFAYVADPRHDPEWCPKVLRVEPVDGTGAPVVGARYRAVHRPIRLRGAMDLAVEIVALEPPRRVELREEDEDGVFRVTYELEAEGPGRTRMRQRSVVDLANVPRWQHPIAKRLIGRHLDGQFRGLRRRLGA